MKAFATGLLKGRRLRWGLWAAAVALYLGLAWAASAGEKQDIQVAGIYIAYDTGQGGTTPGGTAHYKGVHAVVIMLSDNPLTNGRLSWQGNSNADPAGNFAGSGTGLFEVGTWDLDTLTFTPSGGVWVTKWEGKGLVENAIPISYTVKVIGHGVAGEVEGMHFDVEAVGGGGFDFYSGQLLDPHAKK